MQIRGKKHKKKNKKGEPPTKSKNYMRVLDVKEDGTKVIASVDYNHWKKYNGIGPKSFEYKRDKTPAKGKK